MIVPTGTFSDEHMLNVGRPDLTGEDDFRRWTSFHKLVEKTNIPIIVNGVFHQMYEYCLTEQGYLGGGFKYCFWFVSDEDKQKFEHLANAIWEAP